MKRKGEWMKKRTMILALTILASCFYAMCFIALFSKDQSSEQVLLAADESTESKTLVDQVYWIQAGVFKEKSSYQRLKNNLEDMNLKVYCVESNDLIRVVVEPSADENLIDSLVVQLSSQGIECIKKSAQLNENEQSLYLSGKISELLEGVCSK